MSRPRRLKALATALAGATLFATAACGNSSGTAGGGDTGSHTKDAKLAAMVPDSIASDGKVVVATDPTYAPMEFVASDGKTIIGVDPDLGKALGDILGVKFDFQKATFDGIIPGLAAGKYELGMSSFTDTKKREKVVDFVTYFKAGTALMVPSGNPDKLSTSDSSLCGKRVGAEKGTIQADDIAARSKKCQSAGSKPIAAKVFPDQNAVNLALATGRIDAALADSGVAGYMAKKSDGKFEIVGKPYSTAPYGVAVPQDSGDFTKALQGAIDKLIADGTYQKILKHWSSSQGAIDKSEINAAVS
ncbi:MAG TPA: ABC transporter substrate-binding protein [Nocardioidaceae bacterium]|nr:ABC transporter substrate-binding protein [Nocardioidaceae bacterium]